MRSLTPEAQEERRRQVIGQRESGMTHELFRGAVGKDVASRTWRRRDLAGEDVVHLVLGGTVVRVRLDRKATSTSLLVVLGIRRDGRNVLPPVREMGRESEAAWRTVLDDPMGRRLWTPGFPITDGAAGLGKALVALWPAMQPQVTCSA